MAKKWQMTFLSVLPSKPRAATPLYGKGVTNRCNNIEHKYFSFIKWFCYFFNFILILYSGVFYVYFFYSVFLIFVL